MAGLSNKTVLYKIYDCYVFTDCQIATCAIRKNPLPDNGPPKINSETT